MATFIYIIIIIIRINIQQLCIFDIEYQLKIHSLEWHFGIDIIYRIFFLTFWIKFTITKDAKPSLQYNA